MWLDFINPFKPSQEHLFLGLRKVPLLIVRNSRARRYLLRLQRDGTARVTIPSRGSLVEARKFVEQHLDWLERQIQRQQTLDRTWPRGAKIWFRGELVAIETVPPLSIRFGTEFLAVENTAIDLRPAIEKHLRALAAYELPARLMELAALHFFSVKRVTVRNQKSRWGSCSQKGTISLNWRLIQTPDFVRDYIMLHELAHLRFMNHSKRYWREVERLCPGYLEAERWLKANLGLNK